MLNKYGLRAVNYTFKVASKTRALPFFWNSGTFKLEPLCSTHKIVFILNILFVTLFRGSQVVSILINFFFFHKEYMTSQFMAPLMGYIAPFFLVLLMEGFFIWKRMELISVMNHCLKLYRGEKVSHIFYHPLPVPLIFQSSSF